MKKILAISLLIFLLPRGAYALPVYKEVRQNYVKSDSLLLDRHGAPLHELRTDKDHRRMDWTALSDISPALKQAVIHAEDKNFYHHAGVDYAAISVSLFQSLLRQNTRGASTITMQLVSFLEPAIQPKKSRRSLQQKWLQMDAARDLEKKWTKEEIFEAYLNLVTFRSELQGVAAASRALFGKEPHGLNQTESAILAALIRSPNASYDSVFQRSSQIMISLNWPINSNELSGKIKQIFPGANTIQPRMAIAPHVAERLLKDKPKGSTVTCTLDSGLQRFALNSMASQLLALHGQNVSDGAVLVLDNKTGQVLAYATYSANDSNARYVDGIQAKRQAGSTLKPFLYALALDSRILTAASVLNDAPLDISVAGGLYQPHNYDSAYRGPVSVRVALASSLNVPAVLTLNLVGTEAFLNKLRMMGIKEISESGDFYGPSLALGSADVSLWELTNAYRTLANGGRWSEAVLTWEGPAVKNNKTILSAEAAFIVSDILSDREARSGTFGLENSLATKFRSAVKTGTSKDMRDNWCIGYSSQYTVGVWVGNYSGESMWNVSGVSGAAPVWHEMMDYLHRNKSDHKASPPSNVVKKEIASSLNPGKRQEEWFIRGTEPSGDVLVVKQYNEKIVYPPSGTIIALDPDIPQDLQKVFFISRTEDKELKWILNKSESIGTGKSIAWSPRAGKYNLELSDTGGKIIDSVSFEVRGDNQADQVENDTKQ
ncbi:MAG TPA: penicillin-binding protein 1C [Smithella sp.]|nr:penicillin-binding protein 1C [Smithella sp.]